MCSARPSIITRILSLYTRLDPRAETAHERPSTLSTLNPGTHRRASGIEVAPERRISSPVRTNTAAGAVASCWAFLPTELT
jgi:hypothetical protein